MAHLHSYDKDVSFFNIDNHAKDPNASDFESIEKLVNYLAKPISADSKHRDLLIARAILVWLGLSRSKILGIQKLNVLLLAFVPNIELSLAEMPLPRAFCKLCEEAGIESEIVAGEVKDVSYLVGDDTIISGGWVIFKANENWHVVMPAFAVSCLAGYQPGGEVAIESDGVTNVQVQEGRQGSMTFRFNEFWFCTNPKYFATICRAENLQKQLIPRPLSQEEYLGIPEFDEGFFKARLQCLTENSCRLNTKNGKCSIVLLSGNPQAKLLEFSYKFSMVGDDTEGLKDLSRLVMFYPNFARKEFTFEIRFPKVGAYILRIYVPDLQTGGINSCCNFRIECTEVNTHFGKLPIMTGTEGWGVGTRAKDAGLLRPSNPKPKIAIQFPENTNETEEEAIQIEKITFKLDEDTIEDMVYESVICGSDDVEDDDLKTETIVDKDNRLLEIISTIKGQGEYGLVVKAKDKHSTEYESVVNYLLTTLEDKSEIEDADHALASRRKEVVQEGKRSIREERKSKLASEMNVLEKELNALERSSKLHDSVLVKENKESNDNDDVTEAETVSLSNNQREIERYDVSRNEKDGELKNIYNGDDLTNRAIESNFSTTVEDNIRKTEQQFLLNRSSIEDHTEETIPITEACTTSESGFDSTGDDKRQVILPIAHSREDVVENKLNTEEHEAQINRSAGQNDDNDNIQITQTMAQQDEADQNQEVTKIDQNTPSIEQHFDESNNPDQFTQPQQIRHQRDQDKPSQDQHDGKGKNPDQILKATEIDLDKNTLEQLDNEETNQNRHSVKPFDGEENNQDRGAQKPLDKRENNQDNRFNKPHDKADNKCDTHAQEHQGDTKNKPDKHKRTDVKPSKKIKLHNSGESKTCVLM